MLPFIRHQITEDISVSIFQDGEPVRIMLYRAYKPTLNYYVAKKHFKTASPRFIFRIVQFMVSEANRKFNLKEQSCYNGNFDDWKGVMEPVVWSRGS